MDDLLLNRGAQGRELFLFHPEGDVHVPTAGHQTEGALSGLSNGFGADAVHRPEVIAALCH